MRRSAGLRPPPRMARSPFEQDGWDWAIQFREERNRYKLERDDLLSALFTSYDTRLHLSAIILGADDPLEEPLSRQAGQSQSG